MARHHPGSTGNAIVPGWRHWQWHRAALVAICACRGAMGDRGSRGWRDPRIPASQSHWELPGSVLRLCTPRIVSPAPEHGDSAGLPFLQGARVGLEQSPSPPIPRHWSHTRVGGPWGTKGDPHTRAAATRTHLDPGIRWVAPLVPGCARRVTDSPVLSPHYVCLSKFNGL